MELSVLSTGIMEPVSVAEMKSFMGYLGDDQDADIQRMIRVAREWLESRCALSLVNKQYKAYFVKEDGVNGWFELPISPVAATPAIEVAVCGTDVDFEELGLTRKKIRPSVVYSTITSTSDVWYMEVTFNAGATSLTANEVIRKIVATMFSNREDGGGADVNTGRLPYDTLRLIEMIDQNTGF
jgi:uncharacterized phiE125 gp8 family phage protein